MLDVFKFIASMSLVCIGAACLIVFANYVSLLLEDEDDE